MATDPASGTPIAEPLPLPEAELRTEDTEVRTEPRRFTRAVLHNRKAMVGAVILLVILFVAVFPGLIAPDDPHATAYPPNEIWAATGIRFFRRGRQEAAAEPARRGGGSAVVVRTG